MVQMLVGQLDMRQFRRACLSVMIIASCGTGHTDLHVDVLYANERVDCGNSMRTLLTRSEMMRNGSAYDSKLSGRSIMSCTAKQAKVRAMSAANGDSWAPSPQTKRALGKGRVVCCCGDSEANA